MSKSIERPNWSQLFANIEEQCNERLSNEAEIEGIEMLNHWFDRFCAENELTTEEKPAKYELPNNVISFCDYKKKRVS